jgi:cytochrome c peroxidase
MEICAEELMLTETECTAVAGWRLPDELPPARGNRYADDSRAAALGEEIFYDTDFATVPEVSCATCHLPEMAFQDGLPTSEVIEGMPGGRNSPSLLNAAWNEGFYFWDGRADSLWSQPLFAFENEIEMNVTRLAIAHRIFDTPAYRTAYEEIFADALPALDDTTRFPATGKPGDPSWEGMAEADKDAVNRVAANVGKALEAYMRTIAGGPSPVDRYIDGDREAISAQAKEGLVRFVRSNCGECHFGPQLVDDTFHQVSMPSEDRGRASGIEILLASPFNRYGDYFDRDAGEGLELPTGPTAADENAFRTPTMRNVAVTAPYRHDGSRDLVTILMSPIPEYEAGDEVVLAAFLEALTGE